MRGDPCAFQWIRMPYNPSATPSPRWHLHAAATMAACSGSSVAHPSIASTSYGLGWQSTPGWERPVNFCDAPLKPGMAVTPMQLKFSHRLLYLHVQLQLSLRTMGFLLSMESGVDLLMRCYHRHATCRFAWQPAARQRASADC